MCCDIILTTVCVVHIHIFRVFVRQWSHAVLYYNRPIHIQVLSMTVILIYLIYVNFIMHDSKVTISLNATVKEGKLYFFTHRL